MRINCKNKKVLLISDLHFPYAVDDWFEFLEHLHAKYNYDEIISMGDEVDFSGISFHEKDPSMMSPSKELEESIACMKKLEGLFPKISILESNHGSLVYRRQKFAGIPIEVIKPLTDIYGTPLFSWHEEIILETNKGDVYLRHGMSGQPFGLMKEIGMSAVQGHFHSLASINYHASVSGTKFNMFVGCLADQKKLAFAYSKSNMKKFINAVGDIDESGTPRIHLYSDFIPKIPESQNT